MGWLFAYDQSKRSDLIAERVKNQEWKREDGGTVKSIALKHCYKGGMRSGVLYIVWERTTTEKDGKETSMRFIEIDLLQFRRDKEMGSSWGYKDMDCCSGPCNLSCPVSYLELCPPHEGSKWCADWHQKVRDHATAKKASREKLKGLKPGDVVQLVDGLKIGSGTIRTLRPLVVESGYMIYRVKPEHINWAVPVARVILAKTEAEDFMGIPLK